MAVTAVVAGAAADFRGALSGWPLALSRHSKVCPSAEGVQMRSWPGSNACASGTAPARLIAINSLLVRMAVVQALAEDNAKAALDLLVARLLECADGTDVGRASCMEI